MLMGTVLSGLLLVPTQLPPSASPWPGLLGGPARAPQRHATDGWLHFEVRDAATDQPIPAKVTLVGVDGTPDPALTHNDLVRQEGGAILAYNRIMSATGEGDVRVPRGTYDVYVSRGIEWDLHVARRVRIDDKTAPVQARLRHVVDTAGWVSADFHVHAACSYDSQVPMLARVYEFLADGVDMIVSTDHNVVCDYAPLIADLGVGSALTSGTGDEITTVDWGHFGALPLPADRHRAGHGAVPVHGRTPAELFADLRRHHPDALINVHHARADPQIGYFTTGQLDAAADRAGRAGFSFDFDALEVLNGYQDVELTQIDRMIHDWFCLLNHGHRVAATGNSDTHHLTYNLGGYPRNFVRVPDDRPASVTLPQVTRELKAQHAFFTTGPFVRVQVAGAGMGDLAHAVGGRAEALVEVEAAPWISVSRVIVYLNGRELQRWAVADTPTPLRMRKRIPLVVPGDSYFVVRVDGDRSLTPVIGDRAHFDVRPVALTNPVYIDANGDGVYSAQIPHGPH